MVRWADPDAVRRAVEAYAAELKAAHPEVTRVIWYGSWVGGRPTPRSDVDLCVVVSHDERRPRQRVPDYLPRRFPTGVDLTVLTEREWATLYEHSPGWAEAVSTGEEL